MLTLLLSTTAILGASLLLGARVLPLWYDELFTFYAADRESVTDVVAALLSGADNLPPLDAILRHLSMRIFGHDHVGFRLPSVLWYLAGCFWLYRVVYRVSGVRMAAFAAFLVPASTVAFSRYGVEARPYVALFAVSAGALSAWTETIRNPKRFVPDIQLAVLLACAIPLHYYGVVIPFAIAIGEAVRMRAGGPFRSRTLLAGLVAGVVGLSLIPFLQASARHVSAHAWAPPGGFGMILWHYRATLSPLVVPIVLALLLLGFHCCLTEREGSFNETTVPAVSADPLLLTRPFVAAAITLALAPVLVYLLSLLTLAKRDRYSLPLVAGVAALTGHFVAIHHRRRQPVAGFLVFALLVVALYQSASIAKAALSAPLPGPPPLVAQILEEDVGPVVIEDGNVFFLSYHYLGPGQRDRVVKPIDTPTAIRYLGHDAAAVAFRDLRNTIKIGVPDLDEFLRHHRKFLLVSVDGNPGWWLPWLSEIGARLEVHRVSGSMTAYRVEMDSAASARPELRVARPAER